MAQQISMFDHGNFLKHLEQHRDPLAKLDAAVDWARFKPVLKKALARADRKSPAGRPPYDPLMMMKVLVLQSLYGISDAQTEFQILDRYTFKRFLCIAPGDTVPDEKTIWLFRERLGEKGVRSLFGAFDKAIDAAGLTAKKGSLVDASFVDAPRQRNSHEDNETVKGGEVPEDWPENKLRQKDVDARWTKKNNETHFGYKNHVCVDAKRKIVRDYSVTPANTHDSQKFGCFKEAFKKNSSKDVYADSAYRSKEAEEWLKGEGLRSRVCEKGVRGTPMTEQQRRSNREKSRIRSRVEHVFGRMGQCGMDMIRTVGMARAAFRIGMNNLAYNMGRVAALGRCA